MIYIKKLQANNHNVKKVFPFFLKQKEPYSQSLLLLGLLRTGTNEINFKYTYDNIDEKLMWSEILFKRKEEYGRKK